ncbi:DUF5955 family protein [Streptomyces sp. 7R007]
MGGDYNIGIFQSGTGQIHSSGPIAVGKGASATGHQGDAAREVTPEEALRLLRQLLAEHAASLPDAERAQARGELAELSDQLAAGEPDPGRLAGALHRLAAAVGSVTVLATAAEKLREAVGHLLG